MHCMYSHQNAFLKHIFMYQGCVNTATNSIQREVAKVQIHISKIAQKRNGAFGKPCLCPLPTKGAFDENGENDEFTF